jgi:predicted esterase
MHAKRLLLSLCVCTYVYENCVDTSRLAIGGFTDGATYALSVGLANDNLFSHILAFHLAL